MPLSMKVMVPQIVWETLSSLASKTVIFLKRLASEIPATTTAIIPEA